MSEIEERVHSEIGASKADRWIPCPGSRRMCRGRKRQPQEWMSEGTVAHHIAELCLKSGDGPGIFVGQIFQQDGFEIGVTEEMAEAVRVYVRAIRLDMEEHPGAELLIEERFHLSTYHADLFGTCDAILLDFVTGWMKVYDFKYGAFKPVQVEDNPQLKIYGLGALDSLDLDRAVRTVELCIVQPRALHKDGPVRSWATDASEILYWGDMDLVTAALVTEAPNAPLVLGEWCNWCDGKDICPAMRKRVSEVVDLDFDGDLPAVKEAALPPADGLTPEQKAKVLEYKPMIEKWLSAVYEAAKEELKLNPDAIPGFKLVEGKSNRKWPDDFEEKNGVLFQLLKQDLYDVKPKSPAQMEKALKELCGMKPAQIADVIGPLVVTSRGLQVAPEYDKRPRYVPAEKMFPDTDDEITYEF